jgi:hypothetical protein
MKFADWLVGLGIGILFTALAWTASDVRKAEAQAAPPKCGIYQEQETHIGGVKFVRIHDTCGHLVCLQIMMDQFTSNMSPAISCVHE